MQGNGSRKSDHVGKTNQTGHYRQENRHINSNMENQIKDSNHSKHTPGKNCVRNKHRSHIKPGFRGKVHTTMFTFIGHI